jgi:hypothetical protein
MSKPGLIPLTVALCVAASSCTSSSGPSSPSPLVYDGEWNGTTSQGRSITVTVSADQKVTSITVEYNFNGCSGSKTFSNLSLAIARSQPPPGNPQAPGPFDNPGFGFGSGAPDGPDFTQVYGAFTSSQTATGSVVFGGYSGCGNGGAIWTAGKR